jgi:sensor histidine kinase YesM
LGAGSQVHRRTRHEERRAAEFELRAVRLDAELADAQLSSLRAQLHPHFLFNALHTVGGLVREGRDEDALKTLSAIGELLRTTLDQGEKQELRLADELRVARRYLEIEERRFGQRLRLEWAIEEGCGAALVPALCLLPLVENAVRHGVAPRTEGGSVRVTARRAGAELVVEVVDDGPGFPAAVLAGGPQDEGEQARRCIGRANDRARLAMLYGDAQRFELENPPTGGALVRVVLPFRTEPEMPGDAS